MSEPFDTCAPNDQAPSFKLYSIPAILIATFCGSILGGGILLAINYSRLGLRSHAWLSLLGSVVATAVLVTIGWFVPDSWHIPNAVFIFAQLLPMHLVATKLQGDLITIHAEAGGRQVTKWAAAGVGLLACVVLVAAIIGVVLVLPDPLGTQYAASPTEDVYYSRGATRANAEALAEDLRSLGMFGEGREVTVALHRDSKGFIVSFIVGDETLSKPASIAGFTAIGEKLADGSLGHPLTVRLCDPELNTRKELNIP